MITLSVMNDKGGVGKTTSTVNLAAELAARGYRVLVCDLDPQANLTRSSAGLKVENIDPAASTLALVLAREAKLNGPPTPTPVTLGFDLIPAVHRLVDAEVRLVGKERRLAEGLAPFHDRYDVCFLDTAPQFGSLHLNALHASDGVLIPVIPNLSSTSGLDLMFTKTEYVRTHGNARLRPLGVFAVKVQRTSLHRQLQLVLERQLKELWLGVAVPQAVTIENAELFHQSVRDYDAGAKASNAYRLLADALLDRLTAEGLLDTARAA